MEQLRPEVAAQRKNFKRWMLKVDPRKVIVIDESSANTRMARSHAWVRRGEEFVEPRPTNWGKPLTMIGAISFRGWLTLGTLWGAATRKTFRQWFLHHLLPKLRPGDFVVLDNAAIHKCKDLIRIAKKKGVTLKFLPPYSPDLSPIEPGWALVKKQIKSVAPRDRASLHRTAHQARGKITAQQCQGWYRHCGFAAISSDRRD